LSGIFTHRGEPLIDALWDFVYGKWGNQLDGDNGELFRCQRMVAVYEAFDWNLPGQFEAFAHRKVFVSTSLKWHWRRYRTL
jgi:hypothetical protein